jgi:hypothetical protein
MSDRVGGWIETYTGRQFWPLDPRVEDIDIEDIAHALAMKCRYGGHTKWFYSVAQHSVLVAENVAPENRLAALLHDASEAYLADVPRPVKPYLEGYGKIEAAIDTVIAEKFGVVFPWAEEIKTVDHRILADERAALMAPMAVSAEQWGAGLEPLRVPIYPWNPEHAESQFRWVFMRYS